MSNISDKQEQDILIVDASSLVEYSLQLQEGVKNGYAVSVDSDLAPMHFGFSYHACLVREKQPVQEPAEAVKKPVGRQKAN